MITKHEKYLCEFSDCLQYRYAWVHSWGKGHPLMVIGLNPSTADENRMDPTVSKCVEYAKSWNFPGLIMCNLFAYRTTYPNILYRQENPIGENNDFYIKEASKISGCILAAWGNHGKYLNRSDKIRKMFNNKLLYCLKVNKSGEPSHPLYLKKTIKPIPYIYY